MKDLDWAAAFLGRFAIPLCSGGMVSLGVPLLQKGTERLLRAVPAGLDDTTLGVALSVARQRPLRELGIYVDKPLLATDPSALRLLSGLHDALFLIHPRGRELSPSRRAGLLQQVRKQLVTAAESLPELRQPGEQERSLWSLLLGRYSLLAGLWTLRPARTQADKAEPFSLEREVLEVALQGIQQPLVRYLGLACPLALLLRPPPGPLRLIELLPWLALPKVTRLFVTAQLRHGTAQALARLGEALLHIFDTARPSQESPTTQQLWLLLGVHSLLHLRTAISEGLPPVQPSQSDEPLSDSLALYAMVCRHWPWLATPPDVQTDQRLSQQLLRYQAACAELGGRERQQLLHSRCLQALSR